MKICSRCLYPENHPFGIIFDSEGVCSGCRVHEEKNQLNWVERFEKLRRISYQYRSRSGDNYDCIVPVSGARDSYFIVHVVKNILKLNPLLVHYNKHYNTRLGIRNIAYLRIAFDCDLISKVISPDTVRALNRATLEECGSIYWHCIAGQTTFPLHTAVQHQIPLIIWGAHQGVDQVGMFSHLDEVEMTRKYRKEHDLMGLELEDFLKRYENLNSFDLETYRYPHDNEIQAIGLRGIYLNNYLRWDSKSQHETMIDIYGYETMAQQRTFDSYNDIDCFHYSGLHDYIKYIKHGYGKVTDHACREIRLQRMTREAGQKMVKRYENILPTDMEMFTTWMGMNPNKIMTSIEKHRNLKVWKKIGRTNWKRRETLKASYGQAEAARLPVKENCRFRICNKREPGRPDNDYIIIGKGFVPGKKPTNPLNNNSMPSCSGLAK